MDETFTPYIFQYTNYAGKENSVIINANLCFDYESWFKTRIDDLIAKTPDLPDEMIKKILKNANVY
jgi:hypothetical protein